MNAKQFILGGNATFTIENLDTGNYFTFKVRQPDSNKPHFVKVLTGPDNTQDYQFLGTIFNKQTYRHGKKSRITQNAQSAKVFQWLWQNIDNLPDNVEVKHMGNCGVCGRPLTTPESLDRGIGPICWEEMQ